jgi:cation diffusion facilitator CzcD-associated flavoprotein CzcO
MTQPENDTQTHEYLDVIIIGAGLSGIGAAVHLQKDSPNKSYAILEGRAAIGGTWDLFRYPGIRSDSDMYTLGYNFKPWTSPKGIADGKDIREYICEAAQENDIEKNIRFGHKVLSSSWSSKTARWTIAVQLTASGEIRHYECNFLLCCTGYYNYDQGYQPEFTGRENFKGDIIHPQKWDENYDYSNKKVVVIGSGATAVTLVPAMTDKAQHVTMLQRSPSYVMALPQDDPMVNGLRKFLPETWVYRITRTRNIAFAAMMYNYCKKFPNSARRLIQKLVKKEVGKDFDMKHFTPKYNPWDERLCAVPDGDMFTALREGKASIVTDHIDHFTESGIKLKSGEVLEADIIITATGLDVQLFGNMKLIVDGQPFDAHEKMVYRGVLLEDLPNAGMVFGYTNASWTLKADLITEWMCRLLNHMDASGKKIVMPHNFDPAVEHRPFVDMQSGYVQRALIHAPQQGSKLPWKLYQNYALDLATLRFGKVNDDVLVFSNPSSDDPIEQKADTHSAKKKQTTADPV